MALKCVPNKQIGGFKKRIISADQIKRGLEMGTQNIERIIIHEQDMASLLLLFPGKDHQWLCDHFNVNISICGGYRPIADIGDPRIEFKELY